MKEKIEPENDADLLKDLRNSDEYLKEKAPGIIAERKRLGLEGLVGGLQAVIINTEPERQRATAEELLRYTGLEYNGAFQDDEYRTCVLKTPSIPRIPFCRLSDQVQNQRREPLLSAQHSSQIQAPSQHKAGDLRLRDEGHREVRLHPKIQRVRVSHR